jgi:hypothetical protein
MELSYSHVSLVPLMFRLLLKSQRRRNHHVLNKFQHNRFRHEVKHYVPRSINVLIMFAIRKNCHGSERNLLLYQSVKQMNM